MENDAREKKPRGLWDVMRSEAHPAADEEPAESPEPEPIESEDGSDQPSSGKGLWATMGLQPPPVEPPTEPVEADAEEAVEDESSPPPAWFRAKPEAEAESAEEEAVDEPTEDSYEEEPVVEAVVQQPAPAFVLGAEESSPALAKREAIQVKTGRSRGAMMSLLVGLFAVPMTLLAARPEVWTRIPATVLGFGAMVLGLISFNEIQRSRGKQTGTGFAMAGMVLGTIAMFLGPLVVAPWSANQAKASGQKLTRDHLTEIGSALKKYHRKNDRYPPGGTYRVEETGESTALHSWMTDLLPYLGHQSLYQDVLLDEPWSAPGNKPAMSKSVSAFLAGGVEKTRSQNGYGLSHFAALGGQEKVRGGRMANVGIFERSSHVTEKDIHDGESETLIAGEIPENYRPWGEPGNWRTVGEGLNRDTTSFGNADKTGALFLKADGSVIFISNGVSADILKRLSTRDGEDNRMIPDRYR